MNPSPAVYIYNIVVIKLGKEVPKIANKSEHFVKNKSVKNVEENRAKKCGGNCE